MGSTAELWCLTSAWQDVGSRSVSLKNTSLVTLISVIFGFLIKTAYLLDFCGLISWEVLEALEVAYIMADPQLF